MVSFLNSPLSLPAERPLVALDESGEWKYEGTEIAAVGARDLTLAEVADPRIIARVGGDPEAVLLSLSEIEADERLRDLLGKGTRLDGDREPEYKIPWSEWQEYAAAPVKAWLPEYDAVGVDRSLALAERHYRYAKQALDEAGVLRQYLVILAGRLGRSRRVVGETLGLSSARIQQLSESPPTALVADVEQFVLSAKRVAALLGSGTCPRDELPRPRDIGGDEFEEIVASTIAVGLVEEDQNGLRLTKDGLLLLEEKEAKRKPVKSDKERAHAGETIT
jgi:hypothetical protein